MNSRCCNIGFFVVCLGLVGAGVGLLNLTRADEGKFSVKSADASVPKELAEPIQKLLKSGAVQLLDGDKLICDIWLRAELPADATADQLKAGVTYRELKQTEVMGAVQFHQAWTDYRKQKIPAGVYTMRLALQPTDGKHTADVSEFPDFVLLVSAKNDKSADLLEVKSLHEISGDSIGSGHPAVFMLTPNGKPGAVPSLAARPKGHFSLNVRAPLTVEGRKTDATLGIGINLVGHTPAE